ncbi:MAG: methyltransferase [Bacteroidaceae bacterium]|nr:methyltransferase [Bacteroidaceae bacterium]
MSNNYFKFKQFTIFQDNCAMKVGTDGCLLGGWFNCNGSRNILDVGCGSGLISIMAAQRCSADITGIEIEADAAAQARLNAGNCPWKERISIIECNFLEYGTEQLFDTIVSNPPYFVNSLKCDNGARTTARHSDTLGSTAFFKKASELLTPDGHISIIIPCDILQEWLQAASEQGFAPSRISYIKTTPRKAAKRVMIEFMRDTQAGNIAETEETLILESSPGIYSDGAKEILRDFYLKIE